MDEEALKRKRQYAGEKGSPMHRPNENNDYHARRIYM